MRLTKLADLLNPVPPFAGVVKENPLNEFAVTLTTDDDDVSRKWEPYAALPAERIASLKKAHNIGLRTWVSLEPVIDPEAVYRLIKKTHAFVDLFKVGKLNYHPLAKEIDWTEFHKKVKDLLKQLGTRYYIKKDLRQYK